MRFKGILAVLALLLFTPGLTSAADETDTYAPMGAQQPDTTNDQKSEVPAEQPEAEQPPSEREVPAVEQPSLPQSGQVQQVDETGLDDEGLFEDALPERPPTAEEKAKMAGASKRLDIDAVVIIKYMFNWSADSYTVKYHINLGGDINNDTAVIKGNAKVATDISGFLSKTSAFECVLKVSIADVPYEITFRKTSDTEADINVALKGQILEDWESLCTFLDTSNAKFNTRGSPERWISMALEKAKPPLNRLPISIDPTKTTTSRFTINKHTVPDEGLGTAEIEGTGVVTIRPRLPTEQPVAPASGGQNRPPPAGSSGSQRSLVDTLGRRT